VKHLALLSVFLALPVLAGSPSDPYFNAPKAISAATVTGLMCDKEDPTYVYDEWTRGGYCVKDVTLPAPCHSMLIKHLIRVNVLLPNGQKVLVGEVVTSELLDLETFVEVCKPPDAPPPPPPPPPVAYSCGDGACTTGSPETCVTCPQDCWPDRNGLDCRTRPPSTVCGDGICGGVEACRNCARDCGPCLTAPQPATSFPPR